VTSGLTPGGGYGAMEAMTAEAAPTLAIDPAEIGSLELEGVVLPYVDLEGAPLVHSWLQLGSTEYTYVRSFPIKGHSAVMPGAMAELQSTGRQVLVAERDERYYVYLALRA